MTRNSISKPYMTLDVFTDTPYEGNPLAVVLDGAGLSTAQMQATAAEFGYSETTFVLPQNGSSTNGSSRKVPIRIFTPTIEMPFAGHPTIGTAVALALQKPTDRLVLDEKAGPVPVEIKIDGVKSGWARFDAPMTATRGDPVDAATVASVLSLKPEQLVKEGGLPCSASCGARFLIAEVRDLSALQSIRFSGEIPEVLLQNGLDHGVYVFTRTPNEDGVDLRCRMLSPLDGIGEDPATGSAASALVGLLALNDDAAEGQYSWVILQGVEMGRPSRIEAFAEKTVVEGNGAKARVKVSIAGKAVRIMAGHIDIPAKNGQT